MTASQGSPSAILEPARFLPWAGFFSPRGHAESDQSRLPPALALRDILRSKRRQGRVTVHHSRDRGDPSFSCPLAAAGTAGAPPDFHACALTGTAVPREAGPSCPGTGNGRRRTAFGRVGRHEFTRRSPPHGGSTKSGTTDPRPSRRTEESPRARDYRSSVSGTTARGTSRALGFFFCRPGCRRLTIVARSLTLVSKRETRKGCAGRTVISSARR